MQKIYILFSVLIAALCCSYQTFAQTDKEFWFAAPEVSTFSNWDDRPIKLFVTTYGQKATIRISQPATGAVLTTVTIPKDSTRGIDLTQWINNIEAAPANTVIPTGLLITATAPVTMYYEVVTTCKCNPEIFVLKGKNALGTDFWIPSQNVYDNAIPTTGLKPFSSFDIVATENNTTVTITPSKDIVGHSAGSTFNVILNIGEVYSATATGQLAADHLGGSHVVSDKPVAITVKDDELWVGPATCADLVGDQIVPVNLLGREYVAMKGQLSLKEHLFVTATQNSTTVTQDGVAVATINAGQTHTLFLNNPSTYIATNKPVSVFQLTGLGCEFGGAILPALGCTGSYAVSFTRSIDEPLFINVLTKSGGQSGFLVNGIAGILTATDFAPVPGTSGQYQFAIIELSANDFPAGSVIDIKNTGMMFHLGVLNGKRGTGARYGYFSNYGNVAPIIWTNSPICDRDSLNLYTHDITGARYTWSGPNNFASQVAQPYIYPANFSASGNYTLSMQANNCAGASEVELVVRPKPIIHVTPSVSYICPNETMRITASGTDSFEWTPAYKLDTSKGTVVIAAPDVTTTYYIIGIDSNECQVIDSAKVIMKLVPGVTASIDSIVVCPNSAVKIDVKGALTYKWSPPTGLDKIEGSTVTAAPLTESIKYIVIGKASNGCDGADTVVITVSDTVYASVNMLVCSDSSIRFGDTVARDSGYYTQVFRTVNGCDSIVTMHLQYKVDPVADFVYSPILPVMNEPTQFTDNSTGAFSYYWDFGDSSTSAEKAPRYQYKRTGTYRVCLTVRTEENCPDILCKDVDAEVYPNVSVPDAFSPNGDGINDILRLYGGAVSEVHFRVYNRWGQVVFESNGMEKGWDGTINGEVQDADVFAYTLYAVFIDGTVYKKNGNITIIR